MAKKKNETPEVNETAPQNQENTEAVNNQIEETVETPVVETEATVEKPKTKSKKTEKEATVQEIPAAVKKLLALYPNYPALYVNAKGGVFPEKTQPSLVKDAILYQNPYFKQ